jgi:hypothetical protein
MSGIYCGLQLLKEEIPPAEDLEEPERLPPSAGDRCSTLTWKVAITQNAEHGIASIKHVHSTWLSLKAAVHV